MATNRLVVKEEVAVYASVLFDAAHTAGGQEAVLEVRERIDTSILGGIIMDVDGNYIDASMISQLNRARNVLKDTTDGGEC